MIKAEKSENKIRELFELCLRASNETTARVSFDYIAEDDSSRLNLYFFNDRGEYEKHFSLLQFYELGNGDFEEAKKCLLKLLEKGKCPSNLKEESA